MLAHRMTSPARYQFCNRRDALQIQNKSFRLTFRQQSSIGLTGVLIGGLCIIQLFGFDQALFLRPSLIYTIEAPLRAAPGRTNGFEGHDDKYRIGMRRWQNPHGYPVAAFDQLLEAQIANRAVGDV